MRIHYLTWGIVLSSLLITSAVAQKRILVNCPYARNAPCSDLTTDANAPISWIVQSGSTPSSGTGPTNGVDDQYYEFVETSGFNSGDYANLMTAELGVTGTVCVDFYYHMYGEEMGSLNIWVRSGGQDTVVWTKAGDQGDVWYHNRTTLTLSSMTDKIIFNGVRGNGYRGDIGLDSIQITTMSCDDNTQVESTTTMAPTGGSGGSTLLTCNFDSTSDDCSITQDTTEAYDWTISLSGTPSSDTGPATGYAGSMGFIYAEATGQSINDMARFSLPQLGSLDCVRVEFYYHMYGNDMGSLNVYVGDTMFFGKSGNQGNQWLKASFETSMTSNQRVIFEAIRGSEYSSDSAVDSIVVTNCGGSSGGDDTTTVSTVTTTAPGGTGNLPFNCRFDTTSRNCSIAQDDSDQDNWIVLYSATPSGQTGPNSGVGGSGGYIYAEATARQVGDKARFTLPAMVTSGSISCARVRFYYYMYGANLGTLNVYTRQGSDQTNAVSKFTVSGDKGAQWLQTSFTTAMDTNTFIVFESVRGNGYASDIAVDSISVTDCSGSNNTTQKPITTTTATPTNVPYTARLQPQAIWVMKRYPAQFTCAVDDPIYINPFNLSLAWYFPNGSRIVGDATTPGFRFNYVYSANVSLSQLGWWKTTLFVDTSFDYTMSGDYMCKVNYAAYPTTTLKVSLFFQGCPSGYYTCPRAEGCIPCSLLCDGQNDCGDWTDEFKCGGNGAPTCS